MKNELHLDDELIEKLTWLGISGIANVLCCIKMAKYYEFTERDVVGTVLTDSAVMYGSRIQELNEQYGAYNAHEAAMDHALHMLGLKLDNMTGADLCGPQAGPQPEVLHLGGAAGQDRGGAERPVVRHGGHLGRRPRAGQGPGRTDQRFQRGHRAAEKTCKNAAGAGQPPALLIYVSSARI